MARMEADRDQARTFHLNANSELRVLSGMHSDLLVRVKSGSPEVFGSVLENDCTFPPASRFAIFAWKDCDVELIGPVRHAVVAADSTMSVYAAVSAQLQRCRLQAMAEGKRGPVVFVVGPGDAGKSTLTKVLLNYAVRSGCQPLFADLDPGQGQIALPTSVGMVQVTEQLHPAHGVDFSRKATVFTVGHLSSSFNEPQYNLGMRNTWGACQQAMAQEPSARASGAVVNTCGWVEGQGLRNLLDALQVFEADIILVVGDPALHATLRAATPAFVQVALVPKSGGVVSRTKQTRRRDREERVRAYFWGPGRELQPSVYCVSFGAVRLYEVHDQLYYRKANPRALQVGTLLAAAAEPRPAALVLGYLVVQKVDVRDRSLRLLAPERGPLPRYLVMTSAKFSH